MAASESPDACPRCCVCCVCCVGVVRKNPSTKVPSKVWTLQAFNKGALPTLKVEELQPSEVMTFKGTFKAGLLWCIL